MIEMKITDYVRILHQHDKILKKIINNTATSTDIKFNKVLESLLNKVDVEDVIYTIHKLGEVTVDESDSNIN